MNLRQVEHLNHIVQIYSCDSIFYRNDRPEICQEFKDRASLRHHTKPFRWTGHLFMGTDTANGAMLIKHRLRMGNTIRAHLAEFGVSESIGRIVLHRLIEVVGAGKDDGPTDLARRAMMALVDQYRLSQDQILERDRQVMAWHKSNETSYL